MNIIGLAQKVTAIGMGLAGNAKEAVTLNLGRTGDYDPITDTTGGAGTQYPVQALAYRDRNMQARDDSSGSTVTMAIEAAQIPAGTMITEQDTVTRQNGTWQITGAELTASALWILELRR